MCHACCTCDVSPVTCVRSNDRTILLWDWAQGLQCAKPLMHQAEVKAVCFSTSGDLIGSGSGCWVTIWNRDSGRQVARSRGSMTAASIVASVSFHPLTHYSNLVFSGGMDRNIRVWELADSKAGALASKKLESKKLESKKVAAEAHAEELGMLKELSVLKGHSAGVKTLAFSPVQPHTLSTGSCDASIRTWGHYQYPMARSQNAATKTPLQATVHKGHTLTTHSVAWSNDGNLLVSGSADRRVRVWNASARFDQPIPDGFDVGFVVYCVLHIRIAGEPSRSLHQSARVGSGSGGSKAHDAWRAEQAAANHLTPDRIKEEQRLAIANWNMLAQHLFAARASEQTAEKSETPPPTPSG